MQLKMAQLQQQQQQNNNQQLQQQLQQHSLSGQQLQNAAHNLQQDRLLGAGSVTGDGSMSILFGEMIRSGYFFLVRNAY